MTYQLLPENRTKRFPKLLRQIDQDWLKDNQMTPSLTVHLALQGVEA